jgi:hypothetical protein
MTKMKKKVDMNLEAKGYRINKIVNLRKKGHSKNSTDFTMDPNKMKKG